MTFLGKFLLSFLFVLCSQAENISPFLHVRSAFDDGLENIEIFNAVPELHRNGLPSVNKNNNVVPNAFILDSVNSQIRRQERAIDQYPPHKAFHEFHQEPVRPRIPGQRRPTRPGRPTSDTRAPRRFPNGGQHTFDDDGGQHTLRPTSPPSTRRTKKLLTTSRSTSPTKKRTRRPTPTPSYPYVSDSQTLRTRPTPVSDITRSTKLSGFTNISPNGEGVTKRRSTRRPAISDKPFKSSDATRGTRPSGFSEISFNGEDVTRIRPTRRSTISEKPFRTSSATRGTRRPGVTKLSNHFPPHKSFHDFHNEPVKPRIPGRRRTTVSPQATRFPDDIHHSITPISKATIPVRESSKPAVTTRDSEEPHVPQRPLPVASRTSRPTTQSQFPDGRRVTKRRKITLAAEGKTTRFPERHSKVSEKPGFDRRITPTPRPGVTRRHTDRGRTRTKKPTSTPEYTRDSTHIQSITQRTFSSAKSLPPSKTFHDFHFDAVQTKAFDSKTSAKPPERITQIYSGLDISSSRTPTRVTEQPRIQGERNGPASGQRSRTGRPRLLNGKQPRKLTTAQERQTPSGRRRTSIKPVIPSEKPDINQKTTIQSSSSSSTPRRRRPTKHPQIDFDAGQKAKPSSPSPRQFPAETRGPVTSKPLPPHKAFHDFHFEPVRPRLPGNGKANGVPARTSRPELTSRYTSGEFTAQKSRPTPTTPQSIWPRLPGGDRGFITQQPITPSGRPAINLGATRPSAFPRVTARHRSDSTSDTRKGTPPSRSPDGKRRKPTTGTKRPGTSYGLPEQEKSFSISQIPFQLEKKPTRGTQKPRTLRPSDKRVPSVTSRPSPPHKAFHDFHYDPLKHKTSNHSAVSSFGTTKPVSLTRYPGDGSRSRRPHSTPAPRHGIQPRLPDGEQVFATQRPDITSDTQKPRTSQTHPNGKRRQPTSSTKRPHTQSRRPNGRRTNGREPPVDIETFPKEPEYHKLETTPAYTKDHEATPIQDVQGQRTHSRFPNGQRPETTPGVSRHRTKPRFPGDRGARPTVSTFPGERRKPTGHARTQKPRISFDKESTGHPLKIPPHKAFHEFHYAPVKPRFLAGS